MMRKLLLTVSLTVMTTLAVLAQITTAGISGKVVGASSDKEESLPGATIVATHVPSGTTYGTATVNDGRYTIPGMRVGGPYTIKVSFIGYKEQVFENVFLNLGVLSTIDVKLVEEGTQLEEVVISSDRADIINADRNGASASYGTSMINSVPTIGRTVSDVVKYNAYGNGSSFAGQDSRFNNFTIDGSVFNNGFGLGNSSQAGGRTGTTPVSLDAFDEIQLNVAPFDVRQAGFAGASINAVTRSGTNDVSGSAYMLTRGSNMVGREVYKTPLSNVTVDEKTYGVRIGLPIIKNKLFFFGNYEQFTSSTPALSFQLNRGLSGNNSRVTATDMQMVTDSLRKYTGWEAGALDGFNNAITSKKALVRIDWNINQNHKLALRYSHHDSQADQIISGSNSSNTAGFGNRTNSATAMSPENTGYIIMDNTRSLALELNSNFGSKIANKLIGTYNYQNEDRKYKSPLFPTIEIQDGAPSSAATYISLGMDPFTPSNKLRYSTFNFTDNLTYFAGDHTFTAGAAVELYKSDNLFYPTSNGVYVYRNMDDFYRALRSYGANPTSDVSPVSVVRYNLRYSLLPGGADPWQTLKTNTYSLYVQDEWQMTEKLKLTGGLRADLFTYDKKTAEDFYNPIIADFTFADEYTSNYSVNTGAFPKARVLLQPRIGFNYDVKGNKTLQLRGGSGIFVSRIPQVLVSNQLGNNGVNTATVTGSGTAYPFRINPADLPAAVQPKPENVVLANLAPYTVNATDSDLKYPSVWKTNVAVDYKLPFGIIATGEVIYNKVINGLRYIDANLKVPTRSFEGNDTRPMYNTFGSNGNSATSPVNVGRFINPQVTNVFVLKNTNKGSAYTLTAKLERPAIKGFGAMLAYTYGLARDIQSVGSTVQANMPTTTSQNYLTQAYADNDLRHRIIGYFNWRFVDGNEDRGGSTMLSVGMSSLSGLKYSYIYSNDLNGDGQTNDLIYIPKDASDITFTPLQIRNSAGVVTRTFTPAEQAAAYDEYIENIPYLRERRGQYAERNGGAGPWLNRVDLTIVREFFVAVKGKRNTLQLRMDILNFGNMLNSEWGVGYIPTASNFANITPLTVSNAGNTKPTFTMATQVKNGQTILLRDSYLPNVSLANTWQAQFGVRYTFN